MQEAARRENLAAQENESLRAEAARRENLAAQEKEAMLSDARHREKLFLESSDRDKDRAMKEMARREELVRKTALDEAEKRIACLLYTSPSPRDS